MAPARAVPVTGPRGHREWRSPLCSRAHGSPARVPAPPSRAPRHATPTGMSYGACTGCPDGGSGSSSGGLERELQRHRRGSSGAFNEGGTGSSGSYDQTTGDPCDQRNAELPGRTAARGVNVCTNTLGYQVATNSDQGIDAYPTPICIVPRSTTGLNCDPAPSSDPGGQYIHFCDGPDDPSSLGICVPLTSPATHNQGECLPQCTFSFSTGRRLPAAPGRTPVSSSPSSPSPVPLRTVWATAVERAPRIPTAAVSGRRSRATRSPAPARRSPSLTPRRWAPRARPLTRRAARATASFSARQPATAPRPASSVGQTARTGGSATACSRRPSPTEPAARSSCPARARALPATARSPARPMTTPGHRSVRGRCSAGTRRPPGLIACRRAPYRPTFGGVFPVIASARKWSTSLSACVLSKETKCPS